MKKGRQRHVQPTVTEIDLFSKFLGRIETEVEIYSHHVLSCSAEELTTRLGSALIGLVPERNFDVASVPGMRAIGYSNGPAHVDKRLRQMALGSGTHSHGSSGHFSPTAGKPGPHAWRNKDGSLMNAAQRSKEQKKRMKQWPKTTLKAWSSGKSTGKKQPGKKTSTKPKSHHATKPASKPKSHHKVKPNGAAIPPVVQQSAEIQATQ